MPHHARASHVAVMSSILRLADTLVDGTMNETTAAALLVASRALLDAMREVEAADRMEVPRTSKTFADRKARAGKAVAVARPRAHCLRPPPVEHLDAARLTCDLCRYRRGGSRRRRPTGIPAPAGGNRRRPLLPAPIGQRGEGGAPFLAPGSTPDPRSYRPSPPVAESGSGQDRYL